MQSHYRTIIRKQDIGMRISALYRQQQLSIGILDVSSVEVLKETIDWYIQNMNCSIHVIMLEERYEEYSFDELYPDVSFVLFKTLVSLGEQINAFANECYATYFLVVRSDIQMIGFSGSTLLSLMLDKRHPACITPIMLNLDMEVLPTIRTPYIKGREIVPMSFEPPIEIGKTALNLYPVMGIGLYDRALFQRLRGFDEEIVGEYYQLLDFGIRVHLFGYSLFTFSDFAVRFSQKHSIIEDRSECEGMERCYTRALSIHRIAGKNVVEKWKPYVDKKLLKEEVKSKQIILQKTDFFTLIKEWGYEES